MWCTVQLKSDYSGWEELGTGATLPQSKAAAGNVEGDNVYHFWDGEIAHDEAGSLAILDEVNRANGGRVSMMTIGADISTARATPKSCPGRCFCVIAHGTRRCETQYCNDRGICWWVPCGVKC